MQNICLLLFNYDITINSFWAPSAKRFVLCYRSVVRSCLSVCDVCALWPNGWTDLDETWHAGRPRPWPHSVRWGPSPRPPKRGGAPYPIFDPFLFWPNGSMHQNTTWYGCGPQSRGLCVRWRPSPPFPTKGAEPPPNFWPISIVPKRLDASRCHSVLS